MPKKTIFDTDSSDPIEGPAPSWIAAAFADDSSALVPVAGGSTQLAAAIASPAGSTQWTNSAGGAWTSDADWSNGAPTASVDAVLGPLGYYSGSYYYQYYYTVTLSGAGQAHSLAISSNYSTLLVVTNSGSSPASLSIVGNITNSGVLAVDNSGPGGSTVTAGGMLTNTGSVYIGNYYMTVDTTVSAGALVNTGAIYLSGGSGGNTGQATLAIAAAAPLLLSGSYHLSGHALLQFGGGSIEIIDDGASLFLSGPDAFIANASDPASNSALAGLTSNAGNVYLVSGANVAIAGDFSNTGALYVDSYAAYTGGSVLSVGGTLSNDGTLYIGDGYQTASVVVSAAALALSGGSNIVLHGGSGTNTAEAVLNITGEAPSTWTGYLYLYDRARVQFGGAASIEAISDYGYIYLDNEARIANALDANSNSALAGLRSNAGTLRLDSGALAHLQGDFANNGTVYLDNYGSGGSSLTIDGTLNNSGTLYIGYTYGDLGTTVSAAALLNMGTVYLYGGIGTATNQAILAIADAAPSVLTGSFSLYDNAQVTFGGAAGITTIGYGANVLLDGAGAHMANATDPGSNSALTSLAMNDGYLQLVGGASLDIAGDLLNNGYIYVDYYYYEGGSNLTVAGRLTNASYVRVGNGYSGATTIVTVGELVNTGSIDVYGGTGTSTYQARLDIVSGAAPPIWTGRLNLSGNAQVNFASGTIAEVAEGGHLFLGDANSLITNADDRAANSALSGLTRNAGAIYLERGGSLHLTGDFTNFDTFYLGSYYGSGGSTLTVDGVLTNTGYFYAGSNYQTAATTVVVGGFSNTGHVYISGNTSAGMPQTTVQVISAGAPSVLAGHLTVSGNASLEFASGSVESLAYGAQLHIRGGSAFLSNQAAPGSNSALSGLASNAGLLDFSDGAAVHLLGDFTNFSSLYVDAYNYYTYASSLTIDGTLTNTGNIYLGNYYIYGAVTVTVADLVNRGTIQIYGGIAGYTGQTTLNVTGGTTDYGAIYLYENAVLSAGPMTIANGGRIYVYSGGAVTGVSIAAGGLEYVSSGGTAAAPIIAGGTLELAGGTITGGGITFAGVGGTLQIDNTTMPTNTINGFDDDDRIDLRALAFNSANTATYDATSDLLTVSAGGSTYTLVIEGLLDGSQFGVANDGGGGTLVYLLPFAGSTIWSNTAGGDWVAPSNWSNGVPGPTTATTIGVAGSYTVTLTTSGGAGDLTIDNSAVSFQIATTGSASAANLAVQGELTNSGVLYVDPSTNQGGSVVTVGGTLTNRNFTQIGNSGLIGPTSVSVGALVNSGTLYLLGGAGGAPTLSVAGDLLNAASLYIDQTTSNGGSLIAVGGTLTNTSYVQIGSTVQIAASIVSAGSLANSGQIRLYGGTGGNTNQAILDVAAAAPEVWTGQLYLSGHARVEFGGGSIGSVANGAAIVINGGNAIIANGPGNSLNTALGGLAWNYGTLQFDSGVTVDIAGDFVNNGGLHIDQSGIGGSSITVAGTLTNANYIVLGNGLVDATTLSAGALLNTGTIYLYGGSGGGQTMLRVASAAPSLLTGYYYLSGNGAIEFAGGSVESIANGASVVLHGGATIDVAGMPDSNSALLGLRDNAGSLDLRNGSVVATGADLVNNGYLYVGYHYAGASGEGLSVGGTFTNAGYTYIGTTATTGATLTAAGLNNIGNIYLYGGTGSGTGQATLNITSQSAPSVLTGDLYLSGNALVAFAGSDSILALAENGSIVLNGGTARIANATDLGSNSALAGLANNAGSLQLENGAALHLGGDFTNDGSTYVDYYNYYSSPSSLTIDGTLLNNSYLYIGNSYNTAAAATVVTAAQLTNNGAIYVYGGTGSSTYQTILNITSSGAPATLNGDLYLYGRSLVQFAGTDSLLDIAGDGTIWLHGGSALVANAGDPSSNSALSGLQSNAGSFGLASGTVVSTTGDFSNSGYVYVDGYYSYSGGSLFAIGGALHNTGYIYIGNYYQSAVATLRAADLDNYGSIVISGGVSYGSVPSVLDITGAAAPSVLSGYFYLAGNALLQFAGSGSVASIAAGGHVVLNGGSAFIANASDPGSNSALSGLQRNDGMLDLEQGAALHLSGDFLNTGTLYVDSYYYYYGGSTLTVGGTFTNTGLTQFGSYYQSASTTITVGVLVNGGTFYLNGGYYDSAGLTTLNVTGGGIVNGAFYVYQNGTLDAAGLSIANGGRLYVSSGGTAVGAIVGSGGLEYVHSGGTVANGTIAGGTLELAGGTVTAATIEFVGSGGTLQIDTTTMPTNTIVNFRGHQTIDLRAIAGGGAGSGTIGDGNVLTVTQSAVSYTLQLDPTRDYSGVSVILGDDGYGGTLVRLDIPTIFVSAGQTLEVTSGQYEDNIYVLSGGMLIVYAGGTVIDTIDQGIEVLAGGLDIGGWVDSGGMLYVSAGGIASATTIATAGQLHVSAGGSASDIIVDDGGYALVQSGGLSDDSTIAGGTLELDPGALASGLISFAGGGVLQIDGPEMPTAAISGFAQGDFIDITSLAFVPGTTSATLSGTTLIVTNGGASEALTVIVSIPAGFGIEFTTAADGIGGTLVGVQYTSAGDPSVVSSGETRVISAGETSAGLTVMFGGTLLVMAGGTASATVDVGTEILSGGTEFGGTVGSTGLLIVSAGGLASGVLVESGGQLVVSAGGTAAGAHVVGGEVDVLGYASATVLDSGGRLYVDAGGAASATVINADSNETVLSGGSETGATVAGTSAALYLEGTASAVTVGSGGTVQVFSGATASGTTVNSGGRQDVAGVAIGTIVNFGGYVRVEIGGTDIGTAVHGADIEVYGTASGTLIDGGGIANIWTGGLAVGAVLSGGELHDYGLAVGVVVNGGSLAFVEFGGVASATTINSGGAEFVSAGGIASGSIVGTSGNQTVAAGGVASGTVVSSGGLLDNSGLTVGAVLSGVGPISSGLPFAQETVRSGGIASGTIVSAGGGLIISAGGLAAGTVVFSQGLEVVTFGATASGTLVLGAGPVADAAFAARQIVSAGGISISTTLLGSGPTLSGFRDAEEFVASGGIASATIVSSGGRLTISAGGAAHGSVVHHGGREVVSGVATGTLVVGNGPVSSDSDDFAVQVVSSGGVAISTTLIGSGPTISGMRDATQAVVLGGLASATTVSSGGRLVVSSGGLASGAIVLDAAAAVVSSGGLSVFATVNGTGPVTEGDTDARLVVSEGGVASSTTLLGGRITVLSGGTVIGTLVSGGAEIVSSGGIASATTVFTGGSEILSGGMAVGATVESGGALIVSSGGLASSTLVLSGGHAIVSAGGAASGTIVSSGGAESVSGGSEQGGTVGVGGLLQVFGGATGSQSVFGTQSVFGGTVTATAVFAGGVLNVSVAGVAQGTTILGGIEVVFAGGAAFGTTVSAGSQHVSSGGLASGTTILAGGFELVAASGTLIDATVSGAVLQLAAGAIASGTISLAGFEDVLQIDGQTMPGAVIAGFDTDDLIDLRGVAFVSGGSATLGAGNLLTVHMGGSTYGLQLDPGQDFSGQSFGLSADGFGGTLVIVFDANDVGPGETLVLSAGQIVSGITVLSGGTLIVGSGAIVSGALIEGGGVEIIDSGGLDVGATVASGGFQDIFGTASATLILDGGSQTVEVGGTASGTVLNDPAVQDVFGFAGGTQIGDTDVQMVESGGVASGSFIGAGGLEIVFAGGLTIDTTIDGGGTLQLSSGALASGFVEFAGLGGLLQIDGFVPDGFTITGFERGDRIDLTSLTQLDSFSFDPSTGILTISGNFSDTLQFGALPLGTVFGIVDDEAAGMYVTQVPSAPAGLALSPASDGGVAGDNVTNDTTPTITGTGEAGATVTLFANGTAVGSGTVAGNGTWAITASFLGDGAHSLTATQTDAAGNASASSPALVVAIDTTAPVTQQRVLAVDQDSGATPIGIAAPTDAGDTADRLSVTVTGLPSDGTVVLSDGVTAVTAGQILSIQQLTELAFIPTPGVNGQTSTFTYTVTDLAGNTTAGTAHLGINMPSQGPSLVNGLGGAEGFGENQLAANDDGSTGAIDITAVFGGGLNFFGNVYQQLFVNNNGNITFNAGLGTFTPSQITAGNNNPIIAAFWADVDTRGGPGVPTGGNATGSNTVYYDLDTINQVFTVTWNDVGYYAGHTDKLNAFQLQLIGRGNGDFDILFRYQAINWTTGDASGGQGGLGGTPARAGYSAGDGVHAYELPQSGNQDALLGLESEAAPAGTLGVTGEVGVYLFEVRNGIVVIVPPAPTDLALSPDSDSAAAGDNLTNDATPTITGSGQAGNTVSLFDGGNLVGSATVAANGTWAITTSLLADGVHSLVATQSNSGGTSAPSAALTLSIDTSVPTTIPVSQNFLWNSGAQPIGILSPSDTAPAVQNLAVSVTGLPGNGAVTLSDGVTPVALGQTLTISELTGLLFAPAANQIGTTGTFAYTVGDAAGNVAAGTATLGVVPSPTTSLFDFVFTYTSSGDYYFGTVADNGIRGYRVSQTISVGTGQYLIFNEREEATAQAVGTVEVTYYWHNGPGQALYEPTTNADGSSGTQGLGSENGAVLGLDGVLYAFSSASPATFVNSALIDSAFYYTLYPDVAQAGIDAAFHYEVQGWREGRDPNAYFSTAGYLNANPDVRAAGINPLTHYRLYGWQENRDPAANFDKEYYLAHAPDVRQAGIEPLFHYMVAGRAEGRSIAPAIGTRVLKSDGFDPQHYLMTNPDVAAAGVDPHQHFLDYGWSEGRNPSAYFSTRGYLASQPDVAAAGINPLLHYDQAGWREGRDPSALFDTQYYLTHSPDVAAAGINPLVHYLIQGVNEARPILPAVGSASQINSLDFDPQFYLLAYPEIAASGVDPFTDFTTIGWQEGRNPNGLFDTSFYLSHNPDVAAAGVDPLWHYSQFGWKEGRDPSALFGTNAYLAANPDVAAAQIDPLYHFLVQGLYEGRQP